MTDYIGGRKKSRKSARKSKRSSKKSRRSVRGHTIPAKFTGFCVKCRESRSVKTGGTFINKNKRNHVTFVWLCGKCHRCKTKVCRVLGAAK